MAVFLMMLGCAPAPAVPNEAPPSSGSGRVCDNKGLQDLVGRAATSELAAEAQRRSGAAVVRWLRPGDIVTMEFREDRLNISVENGRVTRLYCG